MDMEVRLRLMEMASRMTAGVAVQCLNRAEGALVVFDGIYQGLVERFEKGDEPASEQG